MFFLPTIKSLNPKLKIHLLCLSKGGKDGVRTNELVSSAEFLGISKLKISETNYFVDGLKEKWPHSKIRKTVEDYITKNGIKNVITFDENGVSNHPNHIDIFKAISKSDFFVENKVSLFKLKTVNSLQKYIFFIEFPFTILSKLWNFDEDNFTLFYKV
ncbi:hypothetical protein MHBO_003979 [Bonamia ostreae]|uniref:N-acetylglucosaminylphosphatidylinositol deacetylase n=1 Tax=Bonamia ostreae TaxID=126728 RepID=A0ABV2ASB7_9EUKA